MSRSTIIWSIVCILLIVPTLVAAQGSYTQKIHLLDSDNLVLGGTEEAAVVTAYADKELYRYELLFDPPIAFDTTNPTQAQADVVNTRFEMLGIPFVITGFKVENSDGTQLDVLRNGQVVLFKVNDTVAVTINNNVHRIGVTGADYYGCSVKKKDTTRDLKAGQYWHIHDITIRVQSHSTDGCVLAIGEESLVFRPNELLERKGEFLTSVSGTLAARAQLSGFGFNFVPTTNLELASGQYIEDPLFGSFRIQFQQREEYIPENITKNLVYVASPQKDVNTVLGELSLGQSISDLGSELTQQQIPFLLASGTVLRPEPVTIEVFDEQYTGFDITCTPSWTCEEWQECVEGTQRRVCVDTNYCDSLDDMPVTAQSCGRNETGAQAFVRVLFRQEVGHATAKTIIFALIAAIIAIVVVAGLLIAKKRGFDLQQLMAPTEKKKAAPQKPAKPKSKREVAQAKRDTKMKTAAQANKGKIESNLDKLTAAFAWREKLLNKQGEPQKKAPAKKQGGQQAKK